MLEKLIVIFPIETIARELDGRLLLSALFGKKHHRIFLAHSSLANRLVSKNKFREAIHQFRASARITGGRRGEFRAIESRANRQIRALHKRLKDCSKAIPSLCAAQGKMFSLYGPHSERFAASFQEFKTAIEAEYGAELRPIS